MVGLERIADLISALGSRYCSAIVIGTAAAAGALFGSAGLGNPDPPNPMGGNPSQGLPDSSEKVRVIDGDTLDIGTTRFRLFGIDAPERSQTCETDGGGSYACGEAARRALEALIGGGAVTCVKVTIDRYGRTVATCEAAGLDLGAEMVEAGQAVAFIRYSKRYLPEQAAAQAHNRGLWSGRFVMPWDWRKARP